MPTAVIVLIMLAWTVSSIVLENKHPCKSFATNVALAAFTLGLMVAMQISELFGF